MSEPKWIDIEERMPREGMWVFLRCKYSNGNEVQAVGIYYNDKWEIDWSDDHPEVDDIKYWLDY